jgi:hypothetical protein
MGKCVVRVFKDSNSDNVATMATKLRSYGVTTIKNENVP